MSLAKHLRIIDPAPSDDFVSKREAASKALRAKFLKVRNVEELLKLGSNLALGCFGEVEVSKDIVDSISSALVKESPAFIADERPQEVKVIGLLALLDAINSGGAAERWAVADVLAVAVWSSLSFIPVQDEPKLEALRCEAIETARKRTLRTAVSSRVRTEVPDTDKLIIEPGATSLPQNLGEAIAALRRNASLDREELDLLWWVIADGSDIFQKPLSMLSSVTRSVVTGFEIGSMLRRLPSQAHNHLVQRKSEEAESLSLNDLIAGLGEDRLKIASQFAKETLLTNAPNMYPVLGAIRTGEASGKAAAAKRPLNEWALRVLLESATLRIQYSNTGKL
ncbi:GTPase-associated system all-helical protein GASH [Pseudomonas fluorescens]